MDEAKWPEDDALRDVNFRPTTHGRYEWTSDGEDYVKQYFPPSIADMAYPPENLIAEMDYANVTGTLLHRNPYLGIGNDFIADCVKQYPNRLLGLAHVEEWLVQSEPDASIAKLERAVKEQGLSGLHFLPPQLNLYGCRDAWDAPGFHPFWDSVAELKVPVFFSLKEREDPALESYLAELKTLQRWMERYPDVPVVMTHGLQWRTFMDESGVNLPDAVFEPFENPNLHLQFLFPIALGAVWDYPMPQVKPTIERCVERIGADRIMWGTDMPIVTRFWTYRQNLDFIRLYCDFLSEAETDAILGGTTARLL
ncbi:MAG: amidohydrolase, partial [Chloroflexi bacterium]|nr:amidohydrolase [Chloroflexota bacterium]